MSGESVSRYIFTKPRPARRGLRREASNKSSRVMIRALRRCRIVAALLLDLADGVDHGVERQKRGGVARLVVAHRLEHGDIGPLAVLRRRAVFLEHLAHGLAQRAQLVGFGG